MIEVLYNGIISTISLLNLILIYSILFTGRKKIKGKQIFIVSVFLLAANILLLMETNLLSAMFVNMIFFIIVVTIGFEFKAVESILAMIFTIICYHNLFVVSCLWDMILYEKLIFQGLYSKELAHPINKICIAITFIILCIIVYVRGRGKDTRPSRAKKVLVFNVLGILIFSVSILMGTVAGGLFHTFIDNYGNGFVKLCYVVVYMTYYIVASLLVVKLGKGEEWKKSLPVNTDNQQEKIRQTYINYLMETGKEIDRQQHDWKNYLIALKSFETQSGGEAYIEELLRGKQKAGMYCATGNPLVDSILYEKKKLDDEHSVVIEFDGNLMWTMNLSPIDICIIFSDSLDNAIAACEKMKKDVPKVINIYSAVHKNYLYIAIDNPTDFPIPKNPSGIGLKSIARAVRDMDGNMDINVNNGICKLEIWLPV